jgi:hypothetical protein
LKWVTSMKPNKPVATVPKKIVDTRFILENLPHPAIHLAINTEFLELYEETDCTLNAIWRQTFRAKSLHGKHVSD